jgi:hypothetical protein
MSMKNSIGNRTRALRPTPSGVWKIRAKWTSSFCVLMANYPGTANKLLVFMLRVAASIAIFYFVWKFQRRMRTALSYFRHSRIRLLQDRIRKFIHNCFQAKARMLAGMGEGGMNRCFPIITIHSTVLCLNVAASSTLKQVLSTGSY